MKTSHKNSIGHRHRRPPDQRRPGREDRAGRQGRCGRDGRSVRRRTRKGGPRRPARCCRGFFGSSAGAPGLAAFEPPWRQRLPSAILRLLDLPKQMPANIGEFVEGELKQYVAMSGRRMSSDFCGIGVGSGSRKRLLAVAADAAEVGETLEICGAAGVAVESDRAGGSGLRQSAPARRQGHAAGSRVGCDADPQQPDPLLVLQRDSRLRAESGTCRPAWTASEPLCAWLA